MTGRTLLLWVCTPAVAIVLAACGGPGSRPSWAVSAPSPHEDNTSTSSSPATASAARPAGSWRAVHLAFDVLRIHLPVDTMRHSQKIWNHVDELRVDATLVARLARNGVRIGTVSADAWPAVQTILEACDAEVGKDQWSAQSHLPLTIEVEDLAESETVFCYTPDGRLVGKTFPVGKKLINIDYAVHAEMGGCVDLQVSFEIRHDRGLMTWQRQAGTLRQVPATDRHVFNDLSVMLTLNPGEALVLGPSAEAANEYIVGGRFLVEDRGDQLVETVYCITPLPYQVTDAQR